jgi:hypothetical protein
MTGNDHQGMAQAVKEIMNGRIRGKQKGEKNNRGQGEKNEHLVDLVEKDVLGFV